MSQRNWFLNVYNELIREFKIQFFRGLDRIVWILIKTLCLYASRFE